MKRVLTSILALLFVSFSLVGCSQEEKKIDIPTVMKSIRSEIDLPDMADVGKDRIAGFYDVVADDIVDMACIMAGSGATADEIFIVEASDSTKASEIKTAMEDRKKQQSELFESYNPSENDKIQKCIIETKGNYAFFAICNDSDKAKKIFTDSF